MLTYTNRSGKVYFLRKSLTKTGKPRYFFSSKEDGAGESVASIPDGYAIYENPENAQVFLKQAVPRFITEAEENLVKQHLAKLDMPFRYLTDCKDKCITVYESNHNENFLKSIIDDMPSLVSHKRSETLKQWCISGSFSGVLRFSLGDPKKRTFTAERFCYRSFANGWIYLEGPCDLNILVDKYVRTLGTEEFFQLPHF